jgi:hypothetical protein
MGVGISDSDRCCSAEKAKVGNRRTSSKAAGSSCLFYVTYVMYVSMLLLLEVFFLKFQGSHSEVLEQLILKQRNDMHKVCKVLSRT